MRRQAVVEQRPQDGDQPEQAERGGAPRQSHQREPLVHAAPVRRRFMSHQPPARFCMRISMQLGAAPGRRR